MEHGAQDLECLLDYELSAARRYRRDVSLIMVAGAGDRLKINLLHTIFRCSDELIPLGTDAAILMGETEKMGAAAAIARCLAVCPDEFGLRFAVVSYPKDGKMLEALLATARRRLEQARHCASGAVLTMG
jgi:hypothetical protein